MIRKSSVSSVASRLLPTGVSASSLFVVDRVSLAPLSDRSLPLARPVDCVLGGGLRYYRALCRSISEGDETNPSRAMCGRRWSWIAIALFPATIYSFVIGQKGPLWMLVLAAVGGLLRSRRDGAAGWVFGLLSVKPTLFFLLPIVMLRYGRWRFLLRNRLLDRSPVGVSYCLLPIEVWPGFLDKLGMSGSYASILAIISTGPVISCPFRTSSAIRGTCWA